MQGGAHGILNGTPRFASEADIPLLRLFIRQRTVYAKREEQVAADAQTLRVHRFERRRAEALFALDETDRPGGFALFCPHVSMFRGRTGLYLEDGFVLPAYRGRGYGKALLQALARRPSSGNAARAMGGAYRFRLLA